MLPILNAMLKPPPPRCRRFSPPCHFAIAFAAYFFARQSRRRFYIALRDVAALPFLAHATF